MSDKGSHIDDGKKLIRSMIKDCFNYEVEEDALQRTVEEIFFSFSPMLGNKNKGFLEVGSDNFKIMESRLLARQDELNKANERIESLIADNNSLEECYHNEKIVADDFQCRLNKTQQQSSRYRDALEKIKNDKCDCYSDLPPNHCDCGESYRGIADDALAGGGDVV